MEKDNELEQIVPKKIKIEVVDANIIEHIDAHPIVIREFRELFMVEDSKKKVCKR